MRAARPDGAPVYAILDNLSAHNGKKILRWAKNNNATIDSFNYAPIALIAVLVVATLWWWAAGRSYNPPVRRSRELAELEREVG